MSIWIFEPGHTAAEFRARHMMITWVRGLFKDIHGKLELDWDECLAARFEGEIDAAGLWTGEPNRDAHLRSADFLDVEDYPTITFAGRFTERTASTAFKGEVQLTIRGVTRTVPLDARNAYRSAIARALAWSDVRIGFRRRQRLGGASTGSVLRSRHQARRDARRDRAHH